MSAKIVAYHLLSGELREVAFNPSIPCVLCGKPRTEAPTSYWSFTRGLCRECGEGNSPALESPRSAPPS